jgi:hypothetical protein
MFKKNIFNYFFYFFLIFTSIILIEGIFNHYHYLFHNFTSPSNWYNCTIFYTKHHQILDQINRLIWFENGIVENLQLIFLILATYYFYLFIKNNSNITFKLSKYIYAIYIVGLLYYFFEEMSWGQHFFKWNTPSLFSEINDQNETNIHNTSNLFNQLPRNLLLIWCSLTFLTIKSSFISKYRNLYLFLYPNDNLKKISKTLIFFTSILLIFKFFPSDLYLIDAGSHQEPPQLIWKNELIENLEIKDKILIFGLDILSFKFIRIAELQELLIDFYLLTHAYYLYILTKIKKL